MPSVLENPYYKYYVLTDKKTPRKLIYSNQATLENTLLKGNDTVTKYLILKAIYQNKNGLPIRKKTKDCTLIDKAGKEFVYISGPSGFLADIFFLKKINRDLQKQQNIQYCFATGQPDNDTLNKFEMSNPDQYNFTEESYTRKSTNRRAHKQHYFLPVNTAGVIIPEQINIDDIKIDRVAGLLNKIIGLLEFIKRKNIEAFTLIASTEDKSVIEIILSVYRNYGYISGEANYVANYKETKEIDLYNNTAKKITSNQKLFNTNIDELLIYKKIIEKILDIVKNQENKSELSFFLQSFLKNPEKLFELLLEIIKEISPTKNNSDKATNELIKILRGLGEIIHKTEELSNEEDINLLNKKQSLIAEALKNTTIEVIDKYLYTLLKKPKNLLEKYLFTIQSCLCQY
jgi:hypothetical protein